MKVDYWMQFCDVNMNSRWRMVGNMKIVMSAYLSENDANMMKFGTLADKNDLTQNSDF